MKLRNYLSLLLAACMLISVMSVISCNKDEKGSEPTDEVATDGFFEENRSYMTLSSDVKIVCTRQWSKELVAYSERIAEAIKQKSGLELEIIYKSSGAGNEIVVGYADKHAPSDKAYASIAIGQYAVYVEDSTAVVAAYRNTNLEAAVSAFVEHSIVQAGGEWKIASISEKGDDEDLSTAITAYRIVYAADADEYVTDKIVPYIRERVLDKYKFEMPAVSDAEPAIEHEIVIGKTNRSTDDVSKLYADGSQFDDYGSALIFDEKKIFLLGQDHVAMGVSAGKLFDRVIHSDYGPKLFDLASKPYMSIKMTTKAERELAEGADLRVMSYNILHPSFWSADDERGKAENRIDKAIELLLYYRPDVVGLQEASTPWHKLLGRYFGDLDSYELVCQRSNGGGDNMTCFIYNASTVKVVDSCVIDLEENSEIRVVSVAVFETLKDGKQFVVMNTHPTPYSYREEYAAQMAKIIEIEKQFMEQYSDLPVILTGDFNTTKTAPEFASFIETLNVKEARVEAEEMLYHYAPPGGFGNPVLCVGGGCIDHIFVNANTKVKFFTTVIDDGIQYGSDHLPIYADVTLLQS